ncbi:putative adenylosuccinate lyase [Monocercomonoides exilis]|uniref:putative adenylosuccinate lyase n=1 Tax=Monocercomonoides exilis TaxID=2049356 RepID=UPI00355AA700|nr:putative adenylosuccinate lyase [Monocercomonoides exilis]|eukprot:MONOS_5134.1-p1 / transcript=MONOS_5134.1 / gene=MONOS_5134 / organism=Monocercomonoides_exilis_PA203 / gene_product=putative adenylosuccinate lyase / transcript_product=putative adenylosuccinate lyase / location=Mono_scaffold00146:62816-65784(+) / protein_length=883 / sequence_SO=supercontig / SO=protein_coding / is_pseudo=false
MQDLMSAQDSDDKRNVTVVHVPTDGGSETVIKLQLCSDCEDHPSFIFCESCGDAYCQECFQAYHKRGNRKNHKTHPIKQNLPPALQRKSELEADGVNPDLPNIMKNTFSAVTASIEQNAISSKDMELSLGMSVRKSWRERCLYIPLRLTPNEQREMALVECALNVSEYTEKIDILSGWGTQGRRMIKYLSELLSIVAGLAVSRDYRQGEMLVKGKSFKHNAGFFQHMFEVARRYKITNPDKMRDGYGKLIYALMDSQWSDVSAALGLSCVKPIQTVRSLIVERDSVAALSDRSHMLAKMRKRKEGRRRLGFGDEDESGESDESESDGKGGKEEGAAESRTIHFLDEILDDPLLDIATREIFADGKERAAVQKEIAEKENAVRLLCEKYTRTAEDVEILMKQVRKKPKERKHKKVNKKENEGGMEKEEVTVIETGRVRTIIEKADDDGVKRKSNKMDIEGEEDDDSVESADGSRSESESDSEKNSEEDSEFDSEDEMKSKAKQNPLLVMKPVTADDVLLIIHSLSDNQSFLRYSAMQCQKMLDYLFYYFSPDRKHESPAERKQKLAEEKKNAKKKESENSLLKEKEMKRKSGSDSSSEESSEDKDKESDDDDEEEEEDEQEQEEMSSFSFLSRWNPFSMTSRMGSFLGSKLSSSGPPANKWSAKNNLAISAGQGGARLSHNHFTQFCYVKQTLMLWREIVQDFFKLWCLAEEDLLEEGNRYHLRDTGQGMNRLQSCPRISRAMDGILGRVQRGLKEGWVGSSAVHLCDSNVPNAFMFIDKYTQVSRILTPIVSVLDKLPAICKVPSIRKYVEKEFGSMELCRLEIMQDFFRFGFDGSGSDNFFSSGSCIDGRLTSAWNWCSKIEKKRFFPVFLLCGFVGFDGQF